MRAFRYVWWVWAICLGDDCQHYFGRIRDKGNFQRNFYMLKQTYRILGRRGWGQAMIAFCPQQGIYIQTVESLEECLCLFQGLVNGLQVVRKFNIFFPLFPTSMGYREAFGKCCQCFISWFKWSLLRCSLNNYCNH